MRPHLLLTLLALINAPAAGSVPIVTGDTGRAIDAWMTGMETFGVHGALLVARDGVVLLEKGYGIADRQAGTPITRDTIFDIGSLAKQFTAAAVLTLAMDRKIDLHDPIGRHLPDVPDDKRSITIHHLLTHSAGLPYQPSGEDHLRLPLEFEPGARWQYSNPGYSLLVRIIETVSGDAFESYVIARIFEPAGLRDTGFRGAVHAAPARFARAYTDDTAESSAADALDADFERPYRGAGGVVSCVSDLHRWEQALRSGAVLSAAMVELFFQEHVRNETGALGYAYGWMTGRTIRGTRIVMHAGNLGGFNADYRRYVDEGLTLIFLSNHFVNGRSMRDAVMNNVSLLINDGDPLLPPATAPMTAGERDRRAGVYTFAEGGAVEVRTVPRGIEIVARDQAAMDLVFGSTEETGGFTEEANAASIAVMVGAFDDDDRALREHISPGLPLAGAWADLQRRAADAHRRIGRHVETVAVGTAVAGGQRSGRTYLRHDFDGGAVSTAITWGRGKILHLVDGPPAPARFFAPQSVEAFIAFDIFTGASRQIALRQGEGGFEIVFSTDAVVRTATRDDR